MNKYDKIHEPEDLKNIVNDAFMRAKKDKSKITKPYKKALLTASAAGLALVVALNSSDSFASNIDRIPIIKELASFFKFDKGVEKAASEGHIQIVDESITSKGITLTIEDIVYDNKRLIMKVNYTNQADEHLYLSRIELQDERGNSLENYHSAISYINGADQSKQYALVDISLNQEAEIKGKSISIAPKFASKSNKELSFDSNFKVKIPLNAEPLNKQPQHILIGKTIYWNNTKFTFDNLYIFPTASRMKISGETSEEGFKFERIAKASLIDNNLHIYPNTASTGFSDAHQTLVFESNYFMDYETLNLYVEGIYVSRLDKNLFTIDSKDSKLTTDSPYEFYLKSLSKNNEGGVESITIATNDYRIANKNVNVIPFAFVENLEVDDVPLDTDDYSKSGVSFNEITKEQQITISFKTPVTGKITFELNDLKEYREINQELKIK